MREDRCWICGRPRGLEQRRRSWFIHDTVFVPRTGNKDDHPAQIANDLLVSAGVRRNGGDDDSTHVCNACITVALRALYAQIGTLLGELDSGDVDGALAAVTQRLASLQVRYYNLAFDHNRMQDRLAAVLDQGGEPDVGSEERRLAWWEVERGHVGLDTL